MFDVAGFGASSLDFVYVLPAYPSPEGPRSKLPIQSHFLSPGGQTATAMSACAALGLHAAFAGVTGDDAHGAAIREELTRRGVDIAHATVAGAQPYAIILLAGAERIVLWHRDDAPKFYPADLDVAAVICHVDDVCVETAIAAATRGRAAGRMITTDIDRVTPRTKELIALATHPILAEHVPSALTGEADLARALRSMRSLTPAPIIVTRGAAGAVAIEDDHIIEAPGFHVDAIDTTGAGDVFRAGFIAALLEGRPLKEMMRFGNAAAALSCTRRGAISSVPSRAEVTAVLGSV